MLRITEIVFGLEKSWNHKHRDARLIPWHLCLVALMLGIFNANTLHIYRSSLTPCALFAISALIITVLILIERIFKQKKSNKFLVFWLIGWFTLWFAFGLWLAIPHNRSLPPENTTCSFTGTIEHIPPAATAMDVKLSQWKCQNHTTYSNIRVRITLPQSERNAQHATWNKNTELQFMGSFSRMSAPDVPGMFDAQAWAKSKDYAGKIAIKPGHTPTILHQSSGLTATLENSRRIAFEKLSNSSPEGIIPALILGSSQKISNETRNTFGHLGIAHVLAVSGLHFGIIAILIHAILCFIFGRCPFIMRRFGKKRAAALASIPILALYLVFVGAPISAQRALIMAASATFARIFSTKSNATRSMSLAAILILIVSPQALFQISFQLSFSAVLGIIWGMDFYERILRQNIIENGFSPRVQKALCSLVSMLVMTISTSLTTAPFVIFHFGQLPITGIITNLAVIPYVTFIMMPAAMIAALFEITTLPGHQIVTQIAAFLEKILVQAAQFCDHYLPLSFIEITPNPFVIGASIAVAAAWLLYFNPTKIRFTLAALSSVAMIACILIAIFHPRFLTQPDDLRITFVAMGQADATLIEFPNGHVMLIDAGAEVGRDENSTQSRLIPYLRSLGIHRIDTLVITHSDYDHTAGIPELLNNVEVLQVWHNGLENPQWLHQIDNIPSLSTLDLPQSHHFDSAQIDILWPNPNTAQILAEQNKLTPNESSIVLRLKYGDFSAIFAGDAGIPVEEQLIETHPGPVTVLKAGHHGSKSATSQAWIDELRPQMAIFSTGPHNQYHFPHLEVQNRLFLAKTRMFQTGNRGSVRLTTNGHRVLVDTMH